jgi:hypothetical protein
MRESYTVYIGRPSIFGNPFIIGTDGTRREVLKLFREYAKNNEELLEALDALPPDSVLGCYCKPLPCHGDILIELYKARK